MLFSLENPAWLLNMWGIGSDNHSTETKQCSDCSGGCGVQCAGCEATCAGACTAECVGVCLGSCKGTSYGNMKPPTTAPRACLTCDASDAIRFFVPEEISLYLEKMLTEEVSLREIILSIGNDPDIIQTEKFADILRQYKEAFAGWDFCYMSMMDAYVPNEYRTEMEFSFNDRCFIIKGGKKTMEAKIESMKVKIAAEERDKLQNAWYDQQAYEKLIREGAVSDMVHMQYKIANREYQKAWDEILQKYFPALNRSETGTATWSCDFISCTITVTE